MILLDNFTDINGATEFLPGSQKFNKYPSQKVFDKKKIKFVYPKGSLIIFNGMAWLSPRCAHLMVCKPRENMCLGETVQQAAGTGVAVCGLCCSRHMYRGRGVHRSPFGFCFMTISACIFASEETKRNASSFLSGRATAPEVPRSIDCVRNLKRTSTQYRPHLPRDRDLTQATGQSNRREP